MTENEIQKSERRVFRMLLAFTALCALGVGVTLACGSCHRPEPYSPGNCRAFEYETPLADNTPGVCKILWCDDGWDSPRAGGPAVLWCRPLGRKVPQETGAEGPARHLR
jgi:hypothetical protein